MTRAWIAMLLLVVGCGTTRSSTAYRDATKQLIDGKDPDIKACYDRVLKGTPTAAGMVAVTFAVEPETGKLIDAKLDPGRTNAPDALSECVLSNLANLVVSPGDKHRGQGTWMWSFSATPS